MHMIERCRNAEHASAENTLAGSTLPYVETSLDSGRIGGLPSPSRDTPPLLEPSRVDEDDDVDIYDEPSLKNDKLQNLLLKLRNHDNLIQEQSQPESTEIPTSMEPGESEEERKAPADRQKEDLSETDCDTEDGRTPESVSVDKEEDTLDTFMLRRKQSVRQHWRSVLQSISITLVFINELLSFLMQTLVKGLIVGLLAGVGKVILLLTAAGYYRILGPVITCLIRVTAGIKDILQPILDLVGQIMQHVAQPIQAFQPIKINNFNRDGNCEVSSSFV